MASPSPTGPRDDRTLNDELPDEAAIEPQPVEEPRETLLHEPAPGSSAAADDGSATLGAPVPRPEDGTMAVTPDATAEGTVGLGAASASLIDEVPVELRDHPRYKITQLIGQGGMGAVYRAEHRIMDRTVALKVIHRQFTANAQAVERFRREVQAAAKLHHANIVTAHDAEYVGHTHFLVMEFVAGQTLAEYLRTRKRLPIREACDYARQVARALEHAREHDMVHRDIKPDNLMRTDDGQIKVLDFGLARIATQDLADLADADVGELSSSQLTIAGSLMGTPDYVAPEQVRDSHSADIRADIFSLGCSLYQMLTGQVPFPGGKPLEKIARRGREVPVPAAELRTNLPEQLAGVVAKMMANDPDERYQTPGEVATALTPFVKGRWQAATPRTRRVALVLTGLAVLLVTGLCVTGTSVWLWQWLTTPAQPPRRQPLPVPDAAELAKRPSPLDRLSRDDIPKQLLTQFGGGDPARCPKELVAVFGDSSFAVNNEIGFPAFSPDGKRVATRAGADVRVFDVDTGRVVHSLRRCAGSIGVAYSPDGTKIAAVGHHRTVVVWDAESGKELYVEPAGGQAWTWQAAFSPDSKLLAVSCYARAAKLLDIENKKELAHMPHPMAVYGVAFHPSRPLLATGCGDGRVRLWDFNGKLLRQWQANAGGLLGDGQHLVCTFSPDGTLLATGSDFVGMVWELPEANGAPRLLCRLPFAAVGLLAFSADSRFLYTTRHHYLQAAAGTEPIRKWDARTGQALDAFPTDSRTYEYVTYGLSRDGRLIAGGSIHGTGRLAVYATDPFKRANPAGEGHTANVMSLSFQPGGKLLASGAEDNTIRLWDLETGKQTRMFEHKNKVMQVAFHPRRQLLASAGWDASARVWDLDTGQSINLPHPNVVASLAFSGDGNLLATGGADGKVRLFQGDTHVLTRELTARDNKVVHAVAFDARTTLLAAGVADGSIRVWEMKDAAFQDRHILRFYNGPGDGPDVFGLAGLPDDLQLAAMHSDGSVKLWPWGEDNAAGLLSGIAWRGFRVATRADGKLLAGTSADRFLCLWDLAATPPVTHRIPFPAVTMAHSVAFSPEGRYLVTGNFDGTIYVFRLAAPGKLPAFAAVDALVPEVQFNAHGNQFAHGVTAVPGKDLMVSGGFDLDVRIWDLDAQKQLGASFYVNEGVFCVGVGGDGSVLWTSEGGRLRRSQLDGKDQKIVYTGKGTMRGLAVAANGQALTGGPDGMVRLWGADGQLLKEMQNHFAEIWSVSMSRDARWAASSCVGGRVTLWDLQTGLAQKTFLTDSGVAVGVHGVALSGDGKRLAWGNRGAIQPYNVEQDRMEPSWPGLPNNYVRNLRFSPDGRLLAASGTWGDPTLAIYDTATGNVLDRSPTSEVLALAFTEDSRRLLTGLADGNARVWQLPRAQGEKK